jgi:ubiquinone/menaquinone biosynthesis C-methylase UbiE
VSETAALSRRMADLSVRRLGSSHESATANGQPAEIARLWDVDASGVSIECQLTTPIEIGERWALEIGLAEQTVINEARVCAVTPTARGSYIVRCEFAPPKQNFNGQQRRANVRWQVTPSFPPLCYVLDPCLKYSRVPARVSDFSVAGMAIEMEDRSLPLVPGLALDCYVAFPFSEQLEVVARVRRIGRSKHKGLLTIHCEFESLTDQETSTVMRYLIRFGPASEILNLLRSQSMRGNLSDLVSFDSNVDEEAYERARADFPLVQTERAQQQQPNSSRIIAYLGTLPVATFCVELKGTSPKQELRVSDLSTRAEIRDSGVMTVLTAFIKDACNRSGANMVSSCEESSKLLPTTIDSRSTRRKQARLSRGNTFNNPVSWSDYAFAYDVMCEANPAYSANLSLFMSWLGGLKLPASPKICDVGAGTGNYVLNVAKQYPDAEIFHVERDPTMNRLASQKYRDNQIKNVSFVTADVNDHKWDDNSLDVILAVNALYTLPDPNFVIEKIFSALKPGGHFFTIDLGREMRVLDWSKYVVASIVQARGLVGTIKTFYRARHAVTQNRAIRQAQDHRVYWKHTPSEFRKKLNEAGFQVEDLGLCYRGYCDVAICKKA